MDIIGYSLRVSSPPHTVVPFRFCPSCASAAIHAADGKSVRCATCGFVYFHNNAAATGTVVRYGSEILFIERGQAPAKGLLDVPGGFVDYGETLEQAAIRETFEETGVRLDAVTYLASFPNDYEYRGVLYRTCDVYFEARLSTRPRAQAADDAAAIVWRRPSEVQANELAFASVRRLHRLLSAAESD